MFDGWTAKAVECRRRQLTGSIRAKARLAFAKDPAAMVEAYIGAVDAAMVEAFPPERIAAMKIRDRIRAIAVVPLRDHARRRAKRSAPALAILAMPQNALRALKLGWRTADRMWRLAGDTATDFNHYTKRLTLGAVYSSTLLAWLDDDSEGLGRHRRLPRPPHRRRHAASKSGRPQWRGNDDPPAQPRPLPRPPALPAALGRCKPLRNPLRY